MHSTEVLKCLKFAPLILEPLTCANNQACTDEFLAIVSEGVVNIVYKVVTLLAFSVTLQQKLSGGIPNFSTVSSLHRQTLDSS